MGTSNVVAGTLSRGRQIMGSEWTLAQGVVALLQHCWLVTIDLSVMCLNCHFLNEVAPSEWLNVFGDEHHVAVEGRSAGVCVYSCLWWSIRSWVKGGLRWSWSLLFGNGEEWSPYLLGSVVLQVGFTHITSFPSVPPYVATAWRLACNLQDILYSLREWLNNFSSSGANLHK